MLLAPAAYVILAGQQDIYIDSADTWKNYDEMPLKKSGDFRNNGSMMALCPLQIYGDRHPDIAQALYTDTADINHSMLVASRQGDTGQVLWVLTTQAEGEDASHVELRAPAATPSAAIEEIWRLLAHCEKVK